MPTGKVKWYDPERAFGFLSRDDGGDVFVRKSALPAGVETLKAGTRVEFGIAEGRKGEQALQVRVLDPLPSVAKAAREAQRAERRSPDELHAMVEDMVQVLDLVQQDLRRGRYPEKARGRQVATLVRAVADELDG